MQRLILEYLHKYGESEFYDIYNHIVNSDTDYTISNLRSIISQACNVLIAQRKIILSKHLLTEDYKHKSYYKLI